MTSAVQSPPTPQRPALAREIGRWDYVALVLNAIIGAGIFGLPSKVFALVGSWSLLAYVLCAVLVAMIIACFAELASRFDGTGGPYLYAREAFGAAMGFQAGWLLWLARVSSFAALCNMLLDYLVFFWPAAQGTWRAGLVLLSVAMLAGINLVGVRRSTIVINVLTILKLAALLGFICAGIFFIESTNFSFVGVPRLDAMLGAVTLLVFAFSGFEVAVIPAGEGRDPQKHLPFALITALVIVTAIYLLVQFVSIGTLGGLAKSEKPLAEAAAQFMGRVGAGFIAAGAIISVTGTLNSMLLAAPRLLYAMAEQRQLPGVFAWTHARFRTPHVAIIATSLVVAALTLASTFLSALQISTIIRLLAYAIVCAAVPVMRRRAGRASFVAPAGTLLAGASVLLSAWLIFNQPRRDLALVGITIAVGLLLNLAAVFAPRRRRVLPSSAGASQPPCVQSRHADS